MQGLHFKALFRIAIDKQACFHTRGAKLCGKERLVTALAEGSFQHAVVAREWKHRLRR